MSGILCAIRGGPASQPTIALAIETAKKYNLPIYFLYIVDLDFLASTSSSRLQTISEEMVEMGEFILLATQTQAEREGATAHGVVRRGEVSEEIVALSQEMGADYVILGKPKEEKTNVFTHDRIKSFAEIIHEKTGAEVLFAETAPR